MAQIPRSTIITTATALAFWLAALGPAPSANLFVATTGSDSGQCSNTAPCATIARACRVASFLPDRVVSIQFAATGGTYNGGGCSVIYHQFVGVFGDCSNPPDIVLSGNDFGFFAQDHAILTVQCVSIRSFGKGSIGIGTRQFAIADVNYVRLGQLEDGYGLSAQEASKLNCGAPLEVAGGMQGVVAVGGRSTVTLGSHCVVTLTGTPAFYSFATVVQGSLLEASAKYSGSMLGQRYVCDNSEITGSASLPGSGETENLCYAH